MNRCPVTYRRIGEGRYSNTGLHHLNPALDELKLLPYDQTTLLMMADGMASRIGLKGRRPKLNAILSIKNREFVITPKHGSYFLKPGFEPQGEQLPENEDLSMRLASSCGIETPLHALIYTADESRIYMVRRFDRTGRSGKIHVEDFAQITGRSRTDRYEAEMEELPVVIDRFCTFPVVEKLKLFRRTLFSYLTGHSDLHLKKFSLIHRDGKIELSPAYGLINVTVSGGEQEFDMALPLNGKRAGFTRRDFFDQFGRKTLQLDEKILESVTEQFQKSLPEWRRLIRISFLEPEQQQRYIEVLDRRLSSLR
ncbi:MAG: HipA domain-containing protein [Balneolaceae bacterium]